MLLFDLVSYLALLALLIRMTRVRSLARVSIRFGEIGCPGVVLQCSMQLHTRIGLLNTPSLHIGDGLLLEGVHAIHTLGMHFPIDILFLDETRRVLHWQPNVAPGLKKIKGPKGTRSVLELGAGTISAQFRGLKPYDQIEVKPWPKS
jgi:uncharacterized protein